LTRKLAEGDYKGGPLISLNASQLYRQFEKEKVAVMPAQ